MNASRPVLLHACTSLLLISGLAACQPATEENAVDEANATNEASFNLPAVPLPEPPLDRSALLGAVAQAASASAAGADDTADQAALDGRQFELRIRFGCRGPAPDLQQAVLGWTFDAEERTLRVRATPTISTEGAIVAQVLRRLDGEQIEAVEGFWIPRPWLLDAVCPAAAAVRPAQPQPQASSQAQPQAQPRGRGEAAAAPPSAAPAAPVEDAQESEAPPPGWPKVGIAHFFTATDPRTRRREMRPYQTVKTLDVDQPVTSQGFNLVLSGRLQALPGQRRVIACVSVGPDNPPECIISADLDRVWIERPESREILAEWGSG